MEDSLDHKRSKRRLFAPTSESSKFINQTDRLSSLPDALLLEILSFLPNTRYAVATSALSRRWRHLWIHLNSLRFHYNYHYWRAGVLSFPSEELRYFISTVNDIIFHKLKSTKIHTFCISLTCHTHKPDDAVLSSSFLESCLTRICALSPEVLDISFRRSASVEPCFDLPACLFATPSLKEVYLDSELHYKLPHDGIINLFNLQRLQMSLVDSDRQLLGTLFKSCPLLEHLELRLNLYEKELVLDVVAPNLKCLRVYLFSTPVSYCRVLIDVPKLEQLKIFGHLPFYDFVESPTTLLAADIELNPSGFEGGKDQLKCLFRGISTARSLIFSKSTLIIFNSVSFGDGDISPVFNNLVHLELTNPTQDDFVWSKIVPVFLLSKLKRVMFWGLCGTRDEIKLIKFILSHSKALEQLRVRVPVNLYKHVRKVRAGDINRDMDGLWRDYDFCKVLLKLPRSSPSCQIEFSGLYITGSSSDFSKTPPACKNSCSD